MNVRFTALAASLALAGCGGGNDTETGTVSLALQVAAPPPAFAADACGNELTSAQVVLREVELDRVSEDETEELEDIETGPYLIELTGTDFDGMIQQGFLSAQVPVGTYDEVEFDVHKLDDGDPADIAAAEADPDGLGQMLAADLSIRIAGTNTNGAFTFESDLNEEQEHPVNVVVGDAISGIDGITLTIDPSGWFVDSLGGCLDPADAEDAPAIEEAIKSSIDVEEDDDADGVSDGEDEDDGDDDELS